MAPSADSGKKRKRHTDGTPKPSKRVTIADDKDVKISLKESDSWAPVIASTPGLSVPNSLALKPYSRSRSSGTKNASRSGIASTEILLRSEDDSKLQYTAKEEEEVDEFEKLGDASEPYLKHYVGIYDPETGNLNVMEARSVVVRGTVQAHQPSVEDLSATHYRNQKNALGEAFGTKKAKKAILSITENAIAPNKSKSDYKLDSSASTMLASMAEATASMATKAELDATMNANKPRPPANTETSDITKVYPVEVLVGAEAMAAIQVRSWQVAMKEKRDVKVASRFVANRLLKFKDNIEKLKMLRYILLLLEFYNAAVPGRSGRKLKKPDDLKLILGGQPESLLQGVKRKFSDGPLMSRHHADLLITHVCAIALVVENYELDTWDLKEDFKLEVNPMTQYFKEVGAKVGSMPEGLRKTLGMDKAAATQRRVAKLKIPLDFPTTKFIRARR